MARTREYNKETFSVFVPELNDELYFHCWTTDQWDGFCHHCYCGALEETSRPATTRVKYYNRTWESFRYESVLRRTIDKFPKRLQTFLREQLIERKSKAEHEKAEQEVEQFARLHEGLTDKQKELLAQAPPMQSEQDVKSMMSIMGMMNVLNNMGADK